MKINKLLMLLFTVLLLSGFGHQQADYQYVLTAKSAKISKIKKDKSIVYQLRLYHPGLKVIYFSDRPVRKAGEISLTSFLHRWHVSKYAKAVKRAHIAPNVDFQTSANDFSFSLSKPVYDKNRGVLTYTIEKIHGRRFLHPRAGVFQSPVIFIDSYCLTCAAF